MIINDAHAVITKGGIDDGYRESLSLCARLGYDVVVKKGSYIGQIRRQLEFFILIILNPWLRPLAPIMPPGFPSFLNDDWIWEYFKKKLISTKKEANEDYIYGQFIEPQIARVIEILNQAKGNTNQACITVGDRDSVYLNDPPCLKLISFKVVGGKLDMTVFFRSWDAVNGLPGNLGGLQLLKEYVLGFMDFECADGALIAYSDGLHIYDQYFDAVERLCVDKIVISQEILDEKEAFAKTLQ